MAGAAELLREAAQGRVGIDRRLVRAILDRGTEGAAEVLAFTRESRQDDRMRLDPLLVDLFYHWGTPEALDYFIQAIRRNPADTDDLLVQAILPFGEKAVDPLLQLYEELGEEQGGDIAFLLAGLRVPDPRVRALLRDRLEFDAADGAFLLGLYGDPTARPALQAMLAEIPASETDLRREFTFALEQLDAPEPQYQKEPFDILAEYPEYDLPSFDVLPETERVELLSSPDALVRAGAAHSFFHLETGPRVRAVLFALAQSDPVADVRGRAWESLAGATEEPRIRDAMLAALRDPSRPLEERGGAAVGLYGVAEREDARGLIEALYEEDGPGRVKALEAMWRSLDGHYAQYFPRHLDDADPGLVRQAIRGAGFFQLTSYAGKIASFFDREGDFEDLREDALFAYALAMPGEATRGRVRGMLRKIEALTELSPDETELVMAGLDERLQMAGLAPVFAAEGDMVEEDAEAVTKAGRNDPCPCGSGKKYKKCHGA